MLRGLSKLPLPGPHPHLQEWGQLPGLPAPCRLPTPGLVTSPLSQLPPFSWLFRDDLCVYNSTHMGFERENGTFSKNGEGMNATAFREGIARV